MKYFALFLLLPLFPLAAEPLTEEQISARIEANQKLENDEAAVEAAKVWGEALLALKATEASIASEKQKREEIAKLKEPLSLAAPEEPKGDSSLEVLEELLKGVEQSIEKNEARRTEIATRKKESPRRTASLIEQATKIRAELTELQIPIPGADELESARYQRALQNKRRMEAKLAEITAEQDLLDLESRILTERDQKRQEYGKDLVLLKKNLTVSIKKLENERSVEAGKVIDALDGELSKVGDLQGIVEITRTLLDEKAKLQEKLVKARGYDDEIKGIRDDIKEQFENARRRIELLEVAGLGIDDETGMLLRTQRAKLPSIDEIAENLRSNLEKVAQAEITLIGLPDRPMVLKTLSDARTDEILAEHPEISRARVNELLKQRQEALQSLSDDYRELIGELSNGNKAAKFTITEIEEYSTFIDERLLWIKSTKPIHYREPLEEWGRIADLFGPATLSRVGQSVRSNLMDQIVPFFGAVLISVVIFIRRRFLRVLLKKSSEQAGKRNCTSILPTLKFIGAAILLSLWLPLLLFAFSWLITSPANWKEGLVRLGTVLFLGNLLLKFSRNDGLFVSHFKMRADRAGLIFRNLKWLMPVAAPFVFIVPALTDLESSSSSGRFVFILAMLLMAGFVHHLFHPKRSIIQKEGKSTPFTKFCYVLMMAIPIGFAMGAALGYFASVLTLRTQVGASIGLLILAFLVIRFSTRWALVSRRNLAITQALRRREASLAEKQREAEGGEKESHVPTLEEIKAEAVNVVEVEEQTTQLLKLSTYVAVFFGLWAVWSSTLPALSFLDKVTLWGETASTTQEVDSKQIFPGIKAPESGDEAPGDKVTKIVTERDGRVSLEDLLLSLAFFALTFVAARNIPGLLSLTLFNRINLGPGGNFALTTTVRYLIVLIGIVVALAQIEITWGKVQWLAAAVTLGIGFGLQEIFANFVAGIIMLFERPVRLGDVVTVGEISGKVTQIKIRATTIQQFNNRELLVPNKEFITSQLVNWTLKDSVLRFEIPVGIAYGSDTEKATRILTGIVKDHPNVLPEPGPDVLFVNFGNSTLDFHVRGFVAAVDQLLVTQSEIRYQIDNAFREADIEIAFPQQDIHVRSLPEGMKLTQDS